MGRVLTPDPLRVERSYPYMEAKYPSKLFCMKDIHEYKVPSIYSRNFLGLLHIALQLQCYLEGDCGKPWVMASKCNVVIKVVCVLGGKC